MQNIDKGNSKVDRKIFPSSARGVEEHQRQPGQFPGRGSESSVIHGTARDLPALGKATGKPRHEPGDLGLEADTGETEARAL